MILQGMDGELRIIEKGSSDTAPRKSVTHYLEILFCNMDFSCPLERPRTEERLVLDRNTFNSDTHYVEGGDDVTLAPLSMTFSCMVDDKNYSTTLNDWLANGVGAQPAGGVSVYCSAQSGLTRIYSWDGTTLFGGVSLPTFAATDKLSYRVEVVWDGPSADFGQEFNEVYFPPDQQTITEAEDGLTLSINAQVYGGVSRITTFGTGFTNIVSD